MAARVPPTTAEISARVGVSKSTVSRALRNDRRISEPVRAKIASMAERLGYAPNAIAESLATQRSSIIGFIGSETENYWYQENIQTLVQCVAEAGMQTMMFQVPESGDISDVIPNMIRFRLAGCIVIPSVAVSHDAIASLNKFGIAVVLLNRTMRGAGVRSVWCDQAGGGRALAQFLLAGGHQRIGFIAGIGTPTAERREKGFLRGLADSGASPFARAEGRFTFEDAFAGAKDLLTRPVIPDAIFAANDLMAFAAIDAARGLGLAVPGDLSIVGFDNSRIGEWAAYSLTTIAIPMREMFTAAVAMVRQEVGTGPRTITMPGKLIVRNSARVPEDLSQITLSIQPFARA
jgi:DNA-binding LacI/PurR family transcriptional regulator